MADRASFTAVVLAGGTGRRMGGADKALLTVGADRRTLLDGVLGACEGADRTIVVGPPRRSARPVVWCREDPPGAGPAAGVAAALPLVATDVVVLLAVDLPHVTADLVDQLCRALVAWPQPAEPQPDEPPADEPQPDDPPADEPQTDAVQAVDADGWTQPLLAAYRTAALRDSVERLRAADPRGVVDAPVRALTRGLTSRTLAPCDPATMLDVDTPADLARSRGSVAGQSPLTS